LFYPLDNGGETMGCRCPLGRFAAIMFVVTSLSGCATLYTQVSDHRKTDVHYGFTVPRVYSGTVVDAHGLTADNAAFFALIDLPLSLALDTVLFPYTVFRQKRLGFIERVTQPTNYRSGRGQEAAAPLNSDVISPPTEADRTSFEEKVQN